MITALPEMIWRPEIDDEMSIITPAIGEELPVNGCDDPDSGSRNRCGLFVERDSPIQPSDVIISITTVNHGIVGPFDTEPSWLACEDLCTAGDYRFLGSYSAA